MMLSPLAHWSACGSSRLCESSTLGLGSKTPTRLGEFRKTSNFIQSSLRSHNEYQQSPKALPKAAIFLPRGRHDSVLWPHYKRTSKAPPENANKSSTTKHNPFFTRVAVNSCAKLGRVLPSFQTSRNNQSESLSSQRHAIHLPSALQPTARVTGACSRRDDRP